MTFENIHFSRFQCCAFQALFQILSGPLPIHPEFRIYQARDQLWQLLDQILHVSRRSLIELEPAFTKVKRGEDAGIATAGAIFHLKLETKVGRIDIPSAVPPNLELWITMQMIMDVPEWSVKRVQVSAIGSEAVTLIGHKAHEFVIYTDPV